MVVRSPVAISQLSTASPTASRRYEAHVLVAQAMEQRLRVFYLIQKVEREQFIAYHKGWSILFTRTQ